MTVVPVKYGNLGPHARNVIKYWFGGPVTIAGYVRYWFPDGVWGGDECGCTDDRCIGYHHGGGGDCGCLEVCLGQYATWANGCPVCGLQVDREDGTGTQVYNRDLFLQVWWHTACRPADE